MPLGFVGIVSVREHGGAVAKLDAGPRRLAKHGMPMV